LKILFLIPLTTTYLLSGMAMAQTAQVAVSYTSPIADYQPFVDEKVSSWKAANDKVGQIGGWRAYAKEAQQPDHTPSLAPAHSPVPVQKPAVNNGDDMKANPHAGHMQ
jgi:hypothetical protein